MGAPTRNRVVAPTFVLANVFPIMLGIEMQVIRQPWEAGKFGTERHQR
jgi:hypothetical protein